MKISKYILTDKQAFAAFQQNQATLDSTLFRLLVTVERYPELKSNQNFLALQSQLEGMENRVAVARRDFIQAAQYYNKELRTLPGRMWASLLYPDAEPHENFSVSAEDQQRIEQPPAVSFE